MRDELLGMRNMLQGNDRFSKGDRVQVSVDPDLFKEMQEGPHGGWNDTMALVNSTIY